jgi:hypothetical protein
MATVFRWRGEVIPDIRAWARARGEQMVRVRCTRRTLSPVLLREVVEVTEEVMPESFWNGHLAAQGGPDGSTVWQEISREPA